MTYYRDNTVRLHDALELTPKLGSVEMRGDTAARKAVMDHIVVQGLLRQLIRTLVKLPANYATPVQ